VFNPTSVSTKLIADTKDNRCRNFDACDFALKYGTGVSIDKIYHHAIGEQPGLINILALSYLTFIGVENDNGVWTARYSQEMKNMSDYALSFSNNDIWQSSLLWANKCALRHTIVSNIFNFVQSYIFL